MVERIYVVTTRSARAYRLESNISRAKQRQAHQNMSIRQDNDCHNGDAESPTHEDSDFDAPDAMHDPGCGEVGFILSFMGRSGKSWWTVENARKEAERAEKAAATKAEKARKEKERRVAAELKKLAAPVKLKKGRHKDGEDATTQNIGYTPGPAPVFRMIR
ncbi:hypothetical protein C8F04DRAFT_1271390 [Mycena alexandri]|uniref:Uncharacterized protein n=1 Tax=Mycena alexandri TaxID=1745969 RepID=A0AAD6WQL5_9AGAR|nr:hypothetical protein C8F04DRAFT_1271390 [Mycena alexandri]